MKGRTWFECDLKESGLYGVELIVNNRRHFSPDRATTLAAELNAREAEFAELQGTLNKAVHDYCDSDNEIRSLARTFDIDVDGDSYGVPGVVDVVDAMAKKLSETIAERDRLRAAVEQGIASLRLANQHCGCIADFDEEISDMTTALSAKGEQPPPLTPATGGE